MHHRSFRQAVDRRGRANRVIVDRRGSGDGWSDRYAYYWKWQRFKSGSSAAGERPWNECKCRRWLQQYLQPQIGHKRHEASTTAPAYPADEQFLRVIATCRAGTNHHWFAFTITRRSTAKIRPRYCFTLDALSASSSWLVFPCFFCSFFCVLNFFCWWNIVLINFGANWKIEPIKVKLFTAPVSSVEANEMTIARFVPWQGYTRVRIILKHVSRLFLFVLENEIFALVLCFSLHFLFVFRPVPWRPPHFPPWLNVCASQPVVQNYMMKNDSSAGSFPSIESLHSGKATVQPVNGPLWQLHTTNLIKGAFNVDLIEVRPLWRSSEWTNNACND